MFVDNLIEKIKVKNNPSVIGLDPKLEYIPDKIKNKAFKQWGKNLEGASEAILEFNKRLIDALYDVIPAVKPQAAYYEMYGLCGMKAFEETIDYAKSKDLIVIADGKRNDIGSTAEAYSKAFLGITDLGEGIQQTAFNADALTVNPYLGYDGVKPFIEDCQKYNKGIFVLVKTSNKSSGQLQDLLVYDSETAKTTSESRKSVYQVMAEYVEEWGKSLIGKYGYSSVGAVVGATYPEQVKILRSIMKSAYILVPGYGAQGGTAKDAAHAFDKDGLGAIVNASRSVMCAYKSSLWQDAYGEEGFAEAARAEALRMRDEINDAIGGCK